MASPNLTELTTLPLAPDNYSVLHFTDPQSVFVHSLQPKQKPTASISGYTSAA